MYVVEEEEREKAVLKGSWHLVALFSFQKFQKNRKTSSRNPEKSYEIVKIEKQLRML